MDIEKEALSSGWNYCEPFTNFVIKIMKWLFLFTKTLFLILLWPLIMTCKRCWSEIQFAKAYGRDKFEAQMKRRDHMILSSRARIIEVCIESSFQPLLQHYLLLPTLINYFECGEYHQLLEKKKTLLETFSTISGLQFWSVITSVICLSWSFNFYKVTQKCGALDFSANPVGRICLFVYFTSDIMSTSGVCFVGLLLWSWRILADGGNCTIAYSIDGVTSLYHFS